MVNIFGKTGKLSLSQCPSDTKRIFFVNDNLVQSKYVIKYLFSQAHSVVLCMLHIHIHTFCAKCMKNKIDSLKIIQSQWIRWQNGILHKNHWQLKYTTYTVYTMVNVVFTRNTTHFTHVSHDATILISLIS